MPALSKPKYEAYAKLLAQGIAQAVAYAEAGFKGGRSSASRLATNENIVARVAELRAQADAPAGTEDRPQGRPSGYMPEYAEQAAKLCLLGATDDEMADFFGIHRATLYRWKLDHEDFCDAIKSAKAHADERVERSLYQKATGYEVTEEQAIKIKVAQHEEEVEVVQVRKHIPADTTAAIFWLKNRRKDDWRDKTEVEHRHTFADMSDDELDKELEQAVSGKEGQTAH
ncbi:hypothetical protein ACFFTN_01370 [Aminobacter aganoensis]|uniref:Terminase n=1 Tax=Aminobacter aganoensis TaxID=83264 RepID=A0A7X0KJX8_9HYPH|nr:hypothetical protein [Aminobacter aganoensis]MBB6353491.1 hypothetical protein [Aminobacter aganoensis]